MERALSELHEHLGEIADLGRTQLLLQWDMNVWMPASGAASRAQQLATLQSVLHRKLVDDRIGELLEQLEPSVAELPEDGDERRLVRAARRRWELARKVPTELAAERKKTGAESYRAWVQAREDDDFAAFAPWLERMLELGRRWVECFAPYDDPYDVVLDLHEEGMRTEDVRALFAVVEPELVALVAEHATDEEDAFMSGPFPIPQQEALSRELIERFGATWDAFRLDLTVHPFEASVGRGDIRLTTRYDENDLSALFTVMHECGHGLYEWGSSPTLDRTPLHGGSSMSIHESQSRLWENVVGRSLPFWRWFYPRVQEAFPDVLGTVRLEKFHRAVNRVRRTHVRVDADETSYGLHILLRFELEQELLARRLAVADLPEAWNARFEELLGIPVPSNLLGVLQDAHWSDGLFGYFPTYLVGSVLSAQIWERVREAIPDLDEHIEQGAFSDLHEWLRDAIYVHGSKFTLAETTERVVGGSLDPQPYLRYLEDKQRALASV